MLRKWCEKHFQDDDQARNTIVKIAMTLVLVGGAVMLIGALVSLHYA